MQCPYIELQLPVTFVAPSGGVTKNVPLLIGGLCVIPADTVDESELFAGYLAGVFKLPKATGAGTDFAAGDLVEWDVSAGEVIANGGASDDWDLGYVVTAVATTDTEVIVAKVLATATANV